MKTPRIPLICLLVLAALNPSRAEETQPSFSRDVRPILAGKCFACHGPDKAAREADLRLDDRDAALKLLSPGKPNNSELVRRIFSNDPDEVMPPPSSNESLTDSEKQILRSWITAGAKYEAHWAFIKPVRPSLPNTRFATRVTNGVDNFVFARLERESLKPSSPADKYSLVRRVYLDLIGLPPTPEEADAFVNDTHPQAYDRLVDRLLESERYGERWARDWLDLARYSDTNGYEKDRSRSIWPFRDWVIRALNDDMPFDEFTIKQLAGDMLPDASNADRVATGFHRNTMLNEEGGIDPLEYRFYAMVDRVATTGTVWLGLSVGCAQCHSHKYDPISQTDYYRFMALMNNADEPDMAVRSAELTKRRQQVLAQIEDREANLPKLFPPPLGKDPVPVRRELHYQQKLEEWIRKSASEATDWSILRPHKMETNLPRLEVLADGSIFSTGDITKRDEFKLSFHVRESDVPVSAIRLEVLPDERLPAGGPGRAYYEGRKGDFFLSELGASVDGQSLAFEAASHSYGKISIGSGKALAENVFDGDGSTGWSTSGREGQISQLVLNLQQPITSAGELKIEMLFERHFAASLGRFRLSIASSDRDAKAKSMPAEIEATLARPQKDWKPNDTQAVQRYFNRVAPELAVARKAIDQLRKQLPKYPMTMVFTERPSDNIRPTHRHHRGEYLNPRESVQPALPVIFKAVKKPTNRLEFARWLVSTENPLAARVTVNRAWQAFFGTGLVRSAGDFGTQSEPPSHPRLLDWLATEFVANGWSMKKLHRLIVMSSTYRQSSHASEAAWQNDPRNRLLARGPRFRVPAETVRDLMLKSSGLLSQKMFGPSVYPPQPASVTALAYGNTRWPISTGEDRYRRSLYTFSKRTAPFAAFTVFDAPTGENCVARRDRSNTPLQALTLLNDEMFLEMSRAAAKPELNGKLVDSRTPQQRATRIFRKFVTRAPTTAELDVLLQFRDAQLQRLQSGELDAAKIIGLKANAKPNKSHIEHASWAMVARAIMNLDEVITKP